MIPFNRPAYTGNEDQYLQDLLTGKKLSGDGVYAERCHQWFKNKLNTQKNLLTPSCTHALEMAALLIDIQPGDEVIMPSYTFVSTANAFVLRGARIVFVDIRPDTMNIDEKLIEDAITVSTKAIVAVHYAGVSCEMDAILDIANRHGLYVIEDAAQGMMASYKGKPLGTLGHIGAYSFHETKNYTSGGEGGLLIVNEERFNERAEIIREKGTNRSKFFRGEVDKYTWVDVGSSFLPSELQAAYLYGQLESANDINQRRFELWQRYYSELDYLESKGISLPSVPEACQHNAHIFYMKLQDIQQRTEFIEHMNARGILSVFHYIPLHSSPAGAAFSRFHGIDKYTTIESQRIVRLPLYFNMTEAEQTAVISAINLFFESKDD